MQYNVKVCDLQVSFISIFLIEISFSIWMLIYYEILNTVKTSNPLTLFATNSLEVGTVLDFFCVCILIEDISM